MNNHTPGPWKIGTPSPDISAPATVRADGWDVAHCYGERAEANAILIAAAPELLAAAAHAAKSCHHPACKCHGEYSGFPERYCTCHVQKARAALAKAKGE